MRQAIETKYLSPTNYRGARVVAKAQAGRVIIPWDHSLDADENHTAAARAYAQKMGWAGVWFGGGLTSGRGNVYVCVPEHNRGALGVYEAFTIRPGKGAHNK